MATGKVKKQRKTVNELRWDHFNWIIDTAFRHLSHQERSLLLVYYRFATPSLDGTTHRDFFRVTDAEVGEIINRSALTVRDIRKNLERRGLIRKSRNPGYGYAPKYELANPGTWSEMKAQNKESAVD